MNISKHNWNVGLEYSVLKNLGMFVPFMTVGTLLYSDYHACFFSDGEALVRVLARHKYIMFRVRPGMFWNIVFNSGP
jgi:hypothetical protein